MNKYKNLVLLCLFVLGFGKTLFFSPSLSDVGIVLVLGLVFSFCEYKQTEKKYTDLKNQVDKQDIELKELKEKVTSIKIIQQVKPNSLGFK